MSEYYSDENEYEIESIIDVKRIDGEKKYRVRWKGYSPEDDTWEPKESLDNCPEVIKEFKKRMKIRKYEKEKKDTIEKNPLPSINEDVDSIHPQKVSKSIEPKNFLEPTIEKEIVFEMKNLIDENKFDIEEQIECIHFEFSKKDQNEPNNYRKDNCTNLSNMYMLPNGYDYSFFLNEISNFDEPEAIIDIRNHKLKIEVRIRWVCSQNTYWIPFEVAQALFPQLLISFLLKKWDNGHKSRQ